MTTCRWDGSQSPRLLVGRHAEDCPGGACVGCQPCTEPHCRVCERVHIDGACAECLAATRESLHEIARMCDALPEEVEHRGTDGEAMMLLGPAADPEARGHLEASIACGRVPADYLEHADHEQHPLFVLGTWSMAWRDALDHDDDGGYELPELVDYLDRTMSYMAGFEHVPFEDFARDLRRCAAHIEGVLHDGEQVDKGAPCMRCRLPLTRTWGSSEANDGWECRHCRERSTSAQYLFAVKADYIEQAKWLTDQDMETRTGVKAGTVRVWATRKHVTRKQDSGRVVYKVADVERHAEQSGVAS